MGIDNGVGQAFRAAERVLRLGVLAICVPLLHSAGAQSHSTVRHHKVQEQDPVTAKLNQAEAAIEKKDYASAEALLKEAVASAPDNYTAWYDLGFVYHALGREPESVDAYRKSVQAKPDAFESNFSLGIALAEAQNPEAEQYLRKAAKLTPVSHPAQGQARAWLALGHLLLKSNPQEAATAFREAAVLDPKDPEPHLLAGTALEAAKSPDAEQEYQLALSMDPKSSSAMTALTNYYMTQHRFNDAEALLRKLIVIEPNNAGAHFQLARMLVISGKNDDAVAEFESGLKLDPSDTKAQRDLADTYVDLHKFGDAEKIYVTLLNSSPKDADLHHMLGRALLQDKKFADAERELMTSVQLKPDVGETYGDLAIAANQNKNYALAIKAADVRAKYLPENPMTYFLRATAYDHLLDAKQASKYYHQFLDSSAGKFPDQEWQAKHRLIAIEPKSK